MHCKMLGSTPDLYPLEAGRSPSQCSKCLRRRPTSGVGGRAGNKIAPVTASEQRFILDFGCKLESPGKFFKIPGPKFSPQPGEVGTH